MDNIYVYCAALPDGIKECITPCCDGYTIYLNENLSQEQRMMAYQHALIHIENDDFGAGHYAGDVQEIEARAHGLTA